MDDNNTKFILKEEGCIPFDITKEEYDRFVEEIRKARKKTVQNSIFRLSNLIGITNTKDMLKKIVIELEEREERYNA